MPGLHRGTPRTRVFSAAGEARSCPGGGWGELPFCNDGRIVSPAAGVSSHGGALSCQRTAKLKRTRTGRTPADSRNGSALSRSPLTEHFHFYSAQEGAAKCGFSSTPASTLAGDPEFLRKSRHGSRYSVSTRSENAVGEKRMHFVREKRDKRDNPPVFSQSTAYDGRKRCSREL